MEKLEFILKDVGFSRVERAYDLPQSLICIRSSLRLKYASGVSMSNLRKEFRGLFKKNFLSSARVDICVFRCYK
jgi:hypothetical protein